MSPVTMGEIDDAIEARLEERLKHFEWYLSEKYNLNSDSNPNLGGSNPPNNTEEAPLISPKAGEYMSTQRYDDLVSPNDIESGLQTEALDTMCYIGKYSNMTLREIWRVEDGRAAIKVFAKSQHNISKSSAIVVAFYEGADEQ
jgi:hypothetical protein